MKWKIRLLYALGIISGAAFSYFMGMLACHKQSFFYGILTGGGEAILGYHLGNLISYMKLKQKIDELNEKYKNDL